MATQDLPKTMRAVIHNHVAKTIKVVDDCPVPVPALDQGEHLLKVHSVGLTNGELSWPRDKEQAENFPGVEMSGQVVVAPPQSKYPAGSEIYMRTTWPRTGSAREYSIGLDYELARHPGNLSNEEAASIPVSGITAWQALFDQAGLAPTFDESQHLPSEQQKKVLVNGAAGAAGMWMVQMARAAGCWVAGTCQTRNTDFVRDLGAHDIIDYTKTSIRDYANSEAGTKFDLILDCAGGDSFNDCWYATRPGGLVLSIVPPPDMVFQWVLDRPDDVDPTVEGRFFIMKSKGENLERIADLLEAGRVKPVVDSVYKLEDFEKAFAHVESRRTRGKVVLKVGE